MGKERESEDWESEEWIDAQGFAEVEDWGKSGRIRRLEWAAGCLKM